MTTVQVIKAFFEGNGGRKVEMNELKALSKEERLDLATQAATALGLKNDGSDPPNYV